MKFLQDFQGGQVDLERVNRAYVVLIPKRPGAVTADAHRPICLQNCGVKIASKILTTRLQLQISSLIDMDQTGFIRGRSISENFIMAAELVQCSYKRRSPTLVLKLDFAKAFDSVDWGSLLQILSARGFSDKWKGWVTDLLTSSKSAVLVNGCPGPWFSCKRGLRQGDPLSPYLFIIVADVLQALIKADGTIRHPLAADQSCPVLQYADDTLILLPADIVQVRRLKCLLNQFSEATGLHINFGKSTVVPMHVGEDVIQECVTLLGCRQEGFPQTYLGLPLSNEKLNLANMAPLFGRSDRYLAGWQAALLNHKSRTVLINAVLDALPTYLMSALQLPMGAIDKYDGRRRAFLWSGEETVSGAQCLVAWDTVTRPLEQGGLGVRDIAVQNSCMLLKLLHRIFTATDSSWARWVRSRADLASLTGDMEGTHWAGLRQLLPIYQSITTVRLGNGKSTSFWDDWWLDIGRLSDVLPALASHSLKPTASVHQVLSGDLRQHFAPRLSRVATEELEELRALVAGTALGNDDDARCSDLFASDGSLKTAALYRLVLSATSPNCDFYKFVWKCRAPQRVRFFGWLMVQGRIQCKSNLLKKNIVENDNCEVCGDNGEDTDHIMFECSFTRSFWEALGVGLPSEPSVSRPWELQWPSSVPAKHRDTLAMLCYWLVWKHRNEVVFREEPASLSRLMATCREESRLWRCLLPREDQEVSTAWYNLFSPM